MADGFWFGVVVGGVAATAVFVFVPKVYDEVKTLLTNLVHKTPKAPPPPAPTP